MIIINCYHCLFTVILFIFSYYRNSVIGLLLYKFLFIDSVPGVSDITSKVAIVEVSSNLINAFAKTLQNRNISDFFGSVGGGPAPAASSSSGSAPAKATEKAADAPAAVPEPAE